MKTFFNSKWIPKKHLLKTRLKGKISMNDAIQWQKDLYETSLLIDRPFKLFFDNCGYEFEDINVHKAWREFIPKLLAKHGLIMSLLNNEDKIYLKKEYDILKPVCFGLALVHHDKFKMGTINYEFGNHNQNYFSDNNPAIKWINSLGISKSNRYTNNI